MIHDMVNKEECGSNGVHQSELLAIQRVTDGQRMSCSVSV